MTDTATIALPRKPRRRLKPRVGPPPPRYTGWKAVAIISGCSLGCPVAAWAFLHSVAWLWKTGLWWVQTFTIALALIGLWYVGKATLSAGRNLLSNR